MDETSGGTLATLELALGAACCAFGSGIVHHNDTVIVKALVCVRASARYSVACCVACVLWHDACEACHAARRMASCGALMFPGTLARSTVLWTVRTSLATPVLTVATTVGVLWSTEAERGARAD